ncbi:MAG: hypothetical protein M1828_000794 [Chrysothrix sp. TS-e1954]|nr:MAG: hypothetical protein M1828_000794 [Chrysothrix sp. TS-e1954]
MSRRAVTLLGATAVGGAAYYFYQAGGDPKVAEKKFESDAAKASSKVRSELPGKGQEAKQDIKVSAQEIGSKFDSGLDSAKKEARNIENQARGYSSDAEKKMAEARKNTGSELNKAVDKFDKTVEDGASKAKSGISSWFK